MERRFSLQLKEVPRTMTKKEWYETQRWLRICTRQMHYEIDFNELQKKFVGLITTGQTGL